MSDNMALDQGQLENWLNRAGISHYICDQCNGLHLSGLQELEGVVDSRLFIESWGILLSTELVIRPVALLPIVADLGRLNIDYPTLKLFLDIVDEAMPQLAVGATQLSGAGLNEAQFRLFITTTMEAVRQLASECDHLDYLLPDEDAEQNPRPVRVH
ncbi:MAG TPA: YbjN domain-containing protein [Spongiibacteraceae bacterium]|nr:YbjN domain-containing protein [Spongiibacteraceae bacterium]